MKDSNSLNPKPLGDSIEHVIVIMFENRSFDNVLGAIHPHSDNFDGITPNLYNPYLNNGQTTNINVWPAPTGTPAQIMPFPDPKEDHVDMEEQIANGTMMGFANNYAKALIDQKVDPSIENVRQIMQYYKPYSLNDLGNMPISTGLGKAYAVSDRYFGSGPVQTWPNRLFVHCGTPGHDGSKAYLNNKEYPNYPKVWPPEIDPFKGQLHMKTIFEQLDQVGKSWKVYYNGSKPISGMLKYVYDHWDEFSEGNVSFFEKKSSVANNFFQDIEQDTLPNYSFIEPRYQAVSDEGFKNPNSNHPGSAYVWESNTPINVAHGELMLQKIFKALVAAPETFKKTLLVVTYDEHGGLFDHVMPPSAKSPFTNAISGFNYDAYGPRVPIIFINPYIRSGTVLRPKDSTYPFDHTSIIATLRDQFGVKGHLTPRDQSAPTFKGLINRHYLSLNFGPKNLPDMEALLSPTKEKNGEEISDAELEKYHGTVAYAVYASIQYEKRNSKK